MVWVFIALLVLAALGLLDSAASRIAKAFRNALGELK